MANESALTLAVFNHGVESKKKADDAITNGRGGTKARTEKKEAGKIINTVITKMNKGKSLKDKFAEKTNLAEHQRRIVTATGMPPILNSADAEYDLIHPQSYLCKARPPCQANHGQPKTIDFTVEMQIEFNNKTPPWPQRPKICPPCKVLKNQTIAAHLSAVAAAAEEQEEEE